MVMEIKILKLMVGSRRWWHACAFACAPGS